MYHCDSHYLFPSPSCPLLILWWKQAIRLLGTNPPNFPPPHCKNSHWLPVPAVPISEARCTTGAGTKDKMSLIIAAKGTEQWRVGECGSMSGWGGGQGALVCKPETLAVTVNKLTERLASRKRI